MNAHKKTTRFRQLLVAVAILIFPGFLGTAEGQTQRFSRLDANGDGTVTFEEASALPFMDEQHFKLLDVDGDGVLNQGELPPGPRFGHRGMGRRGFAGLDADGDGMVTIEEASALPFMGEERFEILDTDADGVLSQEELPARPRHGRHGMRRKGSGWLDANGDGTVTFEEASMPRMDEERFKSLDANGDGVLSQEELPARPHHRRHGMGGKGVRWMDESGNDTATFDRASWPCMNEESFSRLDTNDDGVLSQEELPAGCRLAPRADRR